MFPTLTPKLKIINQNQLLCVGYEPLLLRCVGGTTAPFDGDNVRWSPPNTKCCPMCAEIHKSIVQDMSKFNRLPTMQKGSLAAYNNLDKR